MRETAAFFVSAHPQMAIFPLAVLAKNLILGISTICLRLNFSRTLIPTKFERPPIGAHPFLDAL